MNIVIKQSKKFWLPKLKLGPLVSSALCLWYNLDDSYQRVYLTCFSTWVGIFSLTNTVLFTTWRSSICFCWTEFQVIIWSANVYVWPDISISLPCSCPFKDGFSLGYPGQKQNKTKNLYVSCPVLSQFYAILWSDLHYKPWSILETSHNSFSTIFLMMWLPHWLLVKLIWQSLYSILFLLILIYHLQSLDSCNRLHWGIDIYTRSYYVGDTEINFKSSFEIS